MSVGIGWTAISNCYNYKIRIRFYRSEFKVKDFDVYYPFKVSNFSVESDTSKF